MMQMSKPAALKSHTEKKDRNESEKKRKNNTLQSRRRAEGQSDTTRGEEGGVILKKGSHR
jgi:hypothetical protein